jgi:hypothetical protein
MRFISFTIGVMLSALVLTSCEKVIDVDVKEADKNYVIEGVVTNEQGGCLVRISRTKSMQDNNEPDGISGAQVQIRDERGVVTRLEETAPGLYRSALAGVPGTRYELSVTIGSQSFNASSYMPLPVPVDSLYISSMEMLGEKEYMTNILYSDPAEKGNAYRFVQYQNVKKNKVFTIINDELSNGRRNTVTYFNNDEELTKGDHIRVEMQNIDPAVYKYWYSLWQGATGEGNAASPANPTGNITGGALGYFSAHSVSSKTTRVE